MTRTPGVIFQPAPVPPYVPVAVAAAKAIGDQFEKDVVCIVAWEQRHAMVHFTTWGRSERDKLLAAALGEKVHAFLVASGFAEEGPRTTYEDFRLDAARLKVENDRLRRELDQANKFSEALAERCGKQAELLDRAAEKTRTETP